MISNNDLRQRHYDIPILIQNKHLNKKTILYTQLLTAYFCAYYIYEDHDSGSEDSYLFDIDHILHYQPHLNPEELSFYIKKIKS
jgi:hypothetical protein